MMHNSACDTVVGSVRLKLPLLKSHPYTSAAVTSVVHPSVYQIRPLSKSGSTPSANHTFQRTWQWMTCGICIYQYYPIRPSSFIGPVVRMLASGNQDCGFAARKRTGIYLGVRTTGQIDRPFLSRNSVLHYGVSHVAWHGVPLQTTGGTKTRCTKGLQLTGLGATGW
jgi:hypothetical protein